MSELLHVDSRDGVAVWTMSSPPVNAVEARLLDALDEALDSTLADKGTGVIVLASGLRLFSAGADAKWMSSQIDAVGAAGLLERFAVAMDRFRDFCERLHRSRLISVCAIDGHVLAGGLELAAACDLRFVLDNESIQVGVPEMKLFGAMPSGGGGVPFLQRILGASRTLLFVLEGEPLTPRRASELGLVDRLVTSGSAVDAATDFARRISAQAGPIGLEAAKTSVMRGRDLDLGGALALDRSVHWDAMRRGKFLDGVEAFARKFG